MTEAFGLSNWKVVFIISEFEKAEVGTRLGSKPRVLDIYCRKLFLTI